MEKLRQEVAALRNRLVALERRQNETDHIITSAGGVLAQLSTEDDPKEVIAKLKTIAGLLKLTGGKQR